MNPYRNISLDFLRVFAMVAVVAIHLYSMVPSMARVSSAEVLADLSRWAVPVFFMISGRFMLDKPVSLAGLWSGRRIVRLVFIFLFWNYLYWLLRPVALPGIVKCTFDTGEVHLWFMYTLVLMYALIPIFQPMVKGGYGWYFVGIWFFLDVLLPSFNFAGEGGLLYHFKNDLMGVSFGYSGFFVLGYCISERWSKLARFRWGIYGVGVCSLFLSAFLPQSSFAHLLVGGGNNILYVFSAFAIYCLFSQIRISPSSRFARPVLFLSSMSLGVYLIHPLVLKMFGSLGLDTWALALCPLQVVGVVLALVITVIASVVLTYVIDRGTVLESV